MSAALDAQPFFFEGNSTGCLLLHGFSATPQEMRFLGEQLHAHGYTVSGARLAGHGTSLDDFARATWHDWYASAETALSALRAHTASIVVVGQSMGGLLALLLAADHPHDVAAVALLAPALRLSRRWLHWTRPLLPLLARRGGAIEKNESDIADPVARAARGGHHRLPLAAFHQLLVLQRRMRRVLPRVQQPTLIVQSRQDHTVSFASVGMLTRALSGPVQTLILEDSYHVVSVDVDKERVATAVGEFVASVQQTGH